MFTLWQPEQQQLQHVLWRFGAHPLPSFDLAHWVGLQSRFESHLTCSSLNDNSPLQPG